MAWAAAALLAKKKAEASLAAASVSAAAHDDSLSYIQRAARKVRGLSASPRVGGSAHQPASPTNAARAGQALERDASLCISASVAGGAAKVVPEVCVMTLSPSAAFVSRTIEIIEFVPCSADRDPCAFTSLGSVRRFSRKARAQTCAGTHGQTVKGVFPQSTAGRGGLEPA